MAEPSVHYANVVEVQVGPYDVLLRFGTKKDRSRPGIQPDDVECEIYMSPQHAKSLAEILQRAVADYEKQHGKMDVQGPVVSEVK